MASAKELDLRLLAALERDPRKTSRDLAQELGTSANTIRRRLEKLMDTGAVRVVAVPNPGALGYRVQAAIGLTVRPGEIQIAADKLSTFPQIQHVILTTGRYDIFIFPIFRDLPELHDFTRLCLGQVGSVTSHETMVMMKTVKSSWSLLTEPGADDSFPLTTDLVTADERDLRLITELERDGRASIQELAERMGISRSIVRRKYRELLEGKALRVVTMVNPFYLGLKTRGIFLIRVEPAKLDDVAKGVLEFGGCRQIITVAGRYDIIAFAVVRDSESLAEFRGRLLAIPGTVSVDAQINQLFAKRSFSLLTLGRQAWREPGSIL